MEITNPLVQTVVPNGNVTFADTIIHGNCSIYHREGSGLIQIKGITSGFCKKARFRVAFSGNIAVPTGQTVGAISLALTLDGETLPETTMIVRPQSVENFFNVGTETFVEVMGGTSDTIGVTNISAIPIEVISANLIVERVA